VKCKNGSFDFAEALVLSVGAKANVPLWVGNCLKKCAMGKKNKKHWVGLSVGFPVLSIFRFLVLSQWFTFQFSVCRFCFLHLAVTAGGMKRWGVRAASVSPVTNFEARQNA